MNVLPLVFLVLLTLTAITVRQIEHFKNMKILHKEYNEFISEQEGKFLNERQRILYDHDYIKSRQLYFGAFMGKDHQLNESQLEQLKLITKEFMKLLYAQTSFYKKIERSRPQFLDDLLEGIIRAFEQIPVQERTKFNNRVDSLPQIKLADPELQEVFYYMLKGSVSRVELEAVRQISPSHAEKTYPSLLDFITESHKSAQPKGTIAIYRAPKELLTLIYGESAAQHIIQHRKQFRVRKNEKKEAKCQEFKEYLSQFPKNPAISDAILFTGVTTVKPPSD
jgi:hypothetical protein